VEAPVLDHRFAAIHATTPPALLAIGSIDDLIVSGLVLRWAGRRIGVDTFQSHWSGRPEAFELLCRLLGL
jgi:uncharacterized membrane protein YkvA (DUF1232 family)